MDLFDEENIRRARGLGDYHLRSAIVSPDLNALKDRKGRTRETRCYQKLSKYFKQAELSDYSTLVGYLLARADRDAPERIQGQDQLINALQLEINGLPDITKTEGDLLHQTVEILEREPMTTKYTLGRELLQEGLIYLMALSSERQPPEDLVNVKPGRLKGSKEVRSLVLYDTTFHLFGDLLMVEGPVGSGIISLDMYRNLADKFTERENIMIASELGSRLLPEIYPPPVVILTVFRILDDGLSETGNQFYQMVKTFEALMNGMLIKQNDGLFYDQLSYLEETLNGLDYQLRPTADSLIEYLDSLSFNPHHISQIGGLFRIWGHPIVVPKDGFRKVRTIGTADKMETYHIPELATRKFKEIFFLSYYEKHKVYPNCMLMDESDYIAEQVSVNGVINISHPGYSTVGWDNVIIQQTFSFPKSFNLSLIIADRAVSPTRKEWKEIETKGGSQMDPHIRRGPLKAMKDGVIDCEKLLVSINNNPKGLGKNHRIIGLYPKEREENATPRMFALMSFDMRAFSVVTESMIADHIIPYVEGVTMTKSMLDLQKEMIVITKNQASREVTDHITFCLNIDFEKWNLNFRKWMTEGMFREMGRLFGLPEIFNKTYDIFENSIIYLADGSFDLKLDSKLNLVEGTDPDYAYIGHVGGFEGLRQKGWTVFTAVLIASVCSSLGVKTHLMGQGDNQVLMITIYSRMARLSGNIRSEEAVQEIRQTLAGVKDRLVELFSNLGLPIKPLETWISEELFAYGKTPIYRGLPLAMSLKRVSRIFAFSNEDLMTLTNALGAVSANAQAAAMFDVHPAVSYALAKWQHIACAYLFSVYHPLCGGPPKGKKDPWQLKMKLSDGRKINETDKRKISKDNLVLLMVTIPRSLGGYNTLTYYEMIMRGFSDPVSRDMCWLFSVVEAAEEPLKSLIKNWIQPIISPEVNPQHLIQDPTALNILVPPNTASVIKRMIDKSLEALPKNSQFSVWFSEILEVSNESSVRDFCQYLFDTERVNPRFLHDLLGASLYGYCTAITSKVDKTVTLSRMALGSKDVVGSLIKGEKRFYLYFGWRSLQDGGEPLTTDCPNEWVRTIRNLSWGKEIQAVSIPYPTHYLGTKEEDTERPDSWVECYVDDMPLGDPSLLLKSTGHALPYLGSVTKETLSSRGAKAAYGTEPLVVRPINLVRTIGWFIQEDSNFAGVIRELLESVTDLPIESVLYIPELVKGSMTHRYLDMSTQHGSLWMPLYGPATYLHISANSFIEFSRGSQNVTIHFQCLLGLVQFHVINRILGQNDAKRLNKVFRTCKKCIIPVQDDMEDLPKPLDPNLVPERTVNPYLYLKAEKIELNIRHRLEVINRIKVLSAGEIELQPILANHTLEDILSIRSSQRIFYASSAKEAQWDLQTINRKLYLKLDFQDLLLKIIGHLFLMEAETISDPVTYPTFALLKNKIMRRIRQAPTANFVHLGGFYCWEESLTTISSYKWTVMPSSYPINAESVSLAAKSSLINLLAKEQTEPKACNGVLAENVIPDVTKQAKSILCLDTRMRNRCDFCYSAALTSRWSDSVMDNDIFNLRCELGHTVIRVEDLKKLKRTTLPEGPLTDIAVTVMKVSNKGITDVMRIQEEKAEYNVMLSDKDCQESSLKRESMSIPPPMLNPYTKNELVKHYRLPTSALYRILNANDAYLRQVTGGTKGNILVIGDGYGYSSLMTKVLYPNREVVGWTYIEPSTALPHSLRISKPPTHYKVPVQIVTYPSVEEVSDINNPKFPVSFKRVVQDHHISVIVSDIETFYVQGEQNVGKLIPLCWEEQIAGGIMKLEYRLEDFSKLISVVHSCYHHWQLFTIPAAGLDQAVIWLGFMGRRGFRHNYLVPRRTLDILTENLEQEIFRRVVTDGSKHRKRWEIINNFEDTLHLKEYHLTRLSVWFGSVFLSGYLEQDLTKLYYSVKTSYRPAFISYEKGNQAHYLYKNREESLFTCLMTLGLSMLESDDDIIKEFAAGRGWKLMWEKKHNENARGQTGWAPVLVRCDRSEVWRARKDEIFKMVSVLRYHRPEELCRFTRPEAKIIFSYLPRKIRGKYHALIFPISRMATFSTGL